MDETHFYAFQVYINLFPSVKFFVFVLSNFFPVKPPPSFFAQLYLYNTLSSLEYVEGTCIYQFTLSSFLKLTQNGYGLSCCILTYIHLDVFFNHGQSAGSTLGHTASKISSMWPRMLKCSIDLNTFQYTPPHCRLQPKWEKKESLI